MAEIPPPGFLSVLRNALEAARCGGIHEALDEKIPGVDRRVGTDRPARRRGPLLL